MVSPLEYDDPILEKLENLPEHWDKKRKVITLKITAHRDDAAWISSRVYEDVDRGFLSAQILANHSKHSVDLTITLSISVDLTPIITALSLLLYELKTKTIQRYLNRKRKLKGRRRKMKN